MGHCASTVHTIKHRPGAESLSNYSPINASGMITVTAQDNYARPSSERRREKKEEELVIEFLLYLREEHGWEWKAVRKYESRWMWAETCSLSISISPLYLFISLTDPILAV